MVPTPRELLLGWSFVARRHKLGDVFPSFSALDRACELAERLAKERPDDVPAAVFYALVRYPRAAGGVSIYAEQTLIAMLQREGRALVGSEDVLRDVRMRIREKRLGWPEVCDEIRALTAEAVEGQTVARIPPR